MSEGSDVEAEQKMQRYLTKAKEFSGFDKRLGEMVELKRGAKEEAQKRSKLGVAQCIREQSVDIPAPQTTEKGEVPPFLPQHQT